jgi:O-antigen ligase
MFICVFIQWRFRLGVIISAIILFGVVPILIYTSSTVQAKIKTYQENVQQYKHGKFDSQNPSMYLRWTFHKYAKQIIAERPILGYGTGSYPTEYKRLSAIYNNKFENSQPHSDYLWFGAELGYVGMLIFIAFMLTALIRAYTLNPMYREFGIMVTVVYLASCVENGYFTDSVSGLAFFLVIGVIFASKFDPKIN